MNMQKHKKFTLTIILIRTGNLSSYSDSYVIYLIMSRHSYLIYFCNYEYEP